jgi:hypothetical protein
MERSLRAPVVATVEGTPIHGMLAVFAGCLRNVGLGRSVSFVRGSFPCRRPHRRQQVPSGRRGGERRQYAQSACTLRGHAQKARSTLEDTSFARSRDPCTVRPHPRPLIGFGRRVRFGIAVGQTCESRRNRHRGLIERTERGSPRVTASPRRRSCVTRQRRKEVMAFVPARKRELRLVSAHRGSCRSRQAGSWPRISSYAALQKEWRSE